MAKSENKNKNKTQPTSASVTDFLQAIEHDQQRADSLEIHRIMKEITGDEGQMWGPSIIGYGSYHYVYPSGREGDWMMTGFSPRKGKISIYLMSGVGRQTDKLAQLGKYSTGKSCLYIKRLADVDKDVLKEMIATSVEQVSNNDIQY